MKYCKCHEVLIASLVAMSTTACSLQQANQSTDSISKNTLAYQSSAGAFHTYTQALAKQLFDSGTEIEPYSTMMIGTFLPAASLAEETNEQLLPYGVQLQESFVTLASQAGFKVIEFKKLEALQLGKNADLMISRNSSELSKKAISTKYLLVGTYTEQEQSLLLNARLLDARTNHIVAAATNFIPLNTLGSSQKVGLNGGLLYRKEY